MANQALGVNMLAEPLRSLAAASVGATYSAIGSAFAHGIRILLLQNLTDAAVLFSFDGTNDHLILPSEGFILLDVNSNKSNMPSIGAFFAQNTIVYAKQSGVPSTGSVYLSVFYCKEV